MTTSTTQVTGATTAVAVLVDLPIERMWELVTDVPRYGTWSPECQYTEWLYAAEQRPLRAGARFIGRNSYPTGLVASVVCVVTEVDQPRTFAWDVLDEAGDIGSRWRYELTEEDGRTRVLHRFEHGPGATGARALAEADPAMFDGRLAFIGETIRGSFSAMLDGVDYREVPV